MKQSIEEIASDILSLCKGTVSCAILFYKIGKLLLLSNNGSLYHGQKNGDEYFSSERYPLLKVGAENIEQLIGFKFKIINVEPSSNYNVTDNVDETRLDLIANLGFEKSQANLLMRIHPN